MREWTKVVYEKAGKECFAQGYAEEDDKFIELVQNKKRMRINKDKIVTISVFDDDNDDSEQENSYGKFLQ